MKHRVMLGLVVGVCVGWNAWSLRAQESPEPEDLDAPAAVPPPPQASPPPGEEVMTPTRNGFRLTPEMSRMIAKRWLREEVGKDVTLNEQQTAQLAERVGQRFDDIVKEHGGQLGELIEQAITSMVASGGRGPRKEQGEEFARRAKDLLPVARDFLKDFARDARPLLADDQWSHLKERLRRDFSQVDRVEEVMQRWASGGGQDESLFDELERVQDEELTPQERQDRKSRGDARRARRRADTEMNRLSLSRWSAFLKSSAEFFDFNQEQREKGEAILKQYTAHAEKIMDPVWRERCRQNRVKYALRWTVGKENASPWIFHLESEYNQMVAPVMTLEAEFQDQVRALATPEQKEAAVEKIRKQAAEHGMKWDAIDAEILGLGR